MGKEGIILMSFKKKLTSVVAIGVLALGFGAAQTQASGWNGAGSDSITTKADTTIYGGLHSSSGGNYKIVLPAHKVSGATSRTPRIYVTFYEMDGTKKTSIKKFTAYGSMLSKSNTFTISTDAYKDGSDKKAEIKVGYYANYKSSFTVKHYD